ncbi:DUF3310 domain-containing protein [Paenibacillus thailandensis]|uniref:DUF3310 domain-containing protein n=1 Tax=Paenibacillus thailandensis TaxID=393250 RepID=A0ABW5QT49_9BACL
MLLQKNPLAPAAAVEEDTGLKALNEQREEDKIKALTARIHERNAAVDNLLEENKRLHEQISGLKARAADYEQELARWAQHDTEKAVEIAEMQEDRDNWKQEAQELKRQLAERDQAIAELSADRSVLIDTIDKAASASDPVNHPNHYTQGGIETIDFIRSKMTPEEFRGFCKGNVLKYVARANLKGGDEDLRKASVYLGWAVEAQ